MPELNNSIGRADVSEAMMPDQVISKAGWPICENARCADSLRMEI